MAGAAATASSTGVETIDYAPEAYGALRPEVFWQGKKLKLQFDCGNFHGLYRGTESPGHAAGYFGDADVYWNELTVDRTGHVIASDGGVAPISLKVDVGALKPRKPFSWDEQPIFATAPEQGPTTGVFDTALGRDCLRGSVVGVA